MLNSLVSLALVLSGIPTVGGKVVQAAYEEGVDPQLSANVVQCESSFQTNVYGDHGLAYGVAQFHEDTFNRFKLLADAPQLDYWNTDDQITLMEWAFANGYGDAWTCYSKQLPWYNS